MKTAFIALGVMGYPMAGHLAKAGHEVTVYNRTPERAGRWTEEFKGLKGRKEATPKAAARGADIVFMCVGNDDDVRSVVYGDDSVLAGMEDGAILVDHTTASADLARELSEACSEKGVGFLDAPVSGGQGGAESGALTIMVGGDEGDFAKAEPVMDAYAQRIQLLGPAGSGQLTKMVNQICIAGLVQGLSEGLNFADKAGLDGKEVLSAIGKGAAQSWQMDNRGETMVDDEFEFGFAVDWMIKDLGICMNEARRNGARLPITAIVEQFYRQISERGGGRWDTSSLIRLLRTP